jgi:aspartate 1-decarboxylase
MQRIMLKSKIHRATVTDANINYEGSITLDRDLMDAADLKSFEEVHVWNIANGARVVTYVIEGERGSGTVCINGAAAHRAKKGDLVIVANYAFYDESELVDFESKTVYVDAQNRIMKK